MALVGTGRSSRVAGRRGRAKELGKDFPSRDRVGPHHFP
jgi:hypothetical protein